MNILNNELVEVIEHGRNGKIVTHKNNESNKQIKELDCLYSINELIEKSGSSFDAICKGVINLIIPVWQYSKITCARINFNNKKHESENYSDTNWKLYFPIKVFNRIKGNLEIGYLEKQPTKFKGPFLEEEYNLAKAISERLGRVAERIYSQDILRKQSVTLKERTKELECLHTITNLIKDRNYTVKDLFEKLVNIIPQAWQYPDITYARILLKNETYATENYNNTIWKLHCPIKVNNEVNGTLEVGYIEERPIEFDGPFLEEETTLTEVIAEQLGVIVERSCSEESLLNSEEKFRNIFNHNNDAIFITNLKGEILEVNETACHTLGYRKKELIQKKTSDITFPGFYSKINDKQNKIDLGNHLIREKICAKNGNIIPVETSSKIINYNGRTSILTVARDITERQEHERKVLRAIVETEEKEKKRFAEDLHDSLGPILTTIKLYIHSLRSGKNNIKRKKSFLEDAEHLIDEAITSTGIIANNLMPVVLNDFGLAIALKSFCDKICQTKKIGIVLKSNSYQRINRDIETTLFMVVKELINNTLKYANATEIDIELYSYAENVLIEYKDNGSGFDVQKQLNKQSFNMGLKNMVSRISSLSGNIEFASTPEEGFSASIKV